MITDIIDIKLNIEILNINLKVENFMVQYLIILKLIYLN